MADRAARCPDWSIDRVVGKLYLCDTDARLSNVVPSTALTSLIISSFVFPLLSIQRSSLPCCEYFFVCAAIPQHLFLPSGALPFPRSILYHVSVPCLFIRDIHFCYWCYFLLMLLLCTSCIILPYNISLRRGDGYTKEPIPYTGMHLRGTIVKRTIVVSKNVDIHSFLWLP